MRLTIDLTKNEIKRLSELTDIEMDADDEDGLLDDDVSDAVSILIENS